MDTTSKYREILKQTLTEYAKLRPSHGDIRLDTVFDETQDRYLLTQVGWDRGARVKGNLVYAVIRDGKIHLEYDGMGHGIVDDLVSRGICESGIILEYLPEPAA